MYSFGKRPARSLDSFGVSGLLGEECHVFYDQLFTTRHIGRVSDLISARLKKAGPDELRMRALLLFAIFEAYRARGPNAASVPMSVECGIDKEKIAVGVTFKLPQNVKLEGLAERIEDGSPSGSFEALLFDIDSQADRIVLRVQPATRRAELVAVMGIRGKMDPESLASEQPVCVVAIEGEAKETPKAAHYIQLGDLDYPQLLKEDEPGKERAAPSTGEILFKGATELELSLRARARQSVKEEVVRISGVTDHIKEEIIKVAGSGNGETQDQAVMRIQGTEKYQVRIAELEQRIAELEAAQTAPPAEVEHSEEEPAGKSRVGGLLKSVWPFKKSAEDSIEDGEDAEDVDEMSEATQEPEAGEPEVVLAKTSSEPDATETASTNLIVEIENGKMDRTLVKAQKEAGEITKDSRAKKWVDGLMEELVAEKARLHEMAKKLNSSIRQKEHEFRSKEQTLQEELKRRDEMIKQKNAALARTKEQLTTTSMNMERLKSTAKSAADDAHFKQKYNLSQKILEQVKEENVVLKKKSDDLKLKLDQLSVKSRGPSVQDFAEMQGKNERLQRQLEEFKRSNAQLNEKLTEASSSKKTSSAQNSEELKKRLESAVMMASVAQKEVDQLSLRVEELEREESRLKKELERAYNEAKALKAKAGGGGGKVA